MRLSAIAVCCVSAALAVGCVSKSPFYTDPQSWSKADPSDVPASNVRVYAESYILFATLRREKSQLHEPISKLQAEADRLGAQYAEADSKLSKALAPGSDIPKSERLELRSEARKRNAAFTAKKQEVARLKREATVIDPNEKARASYLKDRMNSSRFDTRPEMAAEYQVIRSLTSDDKNRVKLDEAKANFEAVVRLATGMDNDFVTALRNAESRGKDAVLGDCSGVAMQHLSSGERAMARGNRELRLMLEDNYSLKNIYFNALHAVLDVPGITIAK